MRRPVVIGILLLLVALALVLLITGKGAGGWGRETGKLRLKEVEKIDAIVISDAHDSLSIKLFEGRWILDGKDSLNQRSVENILYTAENLQVVSVLSPEQAGELRELREVSFLRGAKVIRAWLAAFSGEQFVLIPRGSASLYTVNLPGHPDLDLGEVFSVSRNHYLDHMLLGIRPSEISFIEVERRGERAFRFTMDEDGNISASLLNPESVLPAEKFDDLSIRLLFSYFTAIRFEESLSPASGQEILNREDSSWLGTLRVGSRSGDLHHLEVFSMPGERPGEADMFKALVRYNNEPEILVVNYIYLDVLMRGIGHYFASGA